MKLNDAKVCIDCDELFEGRVCSKCGSEHFQWLSLWLAPPEVKENHFHFITQPPSQKLRRAKETQRAHR